LYHFNLKGASTQQLSTCICTGLILAGNRFLIKHSLSRAPALCLRDTSVNFHEGSFIG